MAPEVTPSDDFADRAQAIKEAIAREETVVSPPPVVTIDEPAVAAEPAVEARQDEDAAAAAPDVEAGEDEAADVATPAEKPAAEEQPETRGRVVVGEDDLLADVDSGVNEDEFKW
jgi:hypothetical protein